LKKLKFVDTFKPLLKEVQPIFIKRMVKNPIFGLIPFLKVDIACQVKNWYYLFQ